MPTNTESLNRDLFRLLSKYKPKPLDAEGKVTPVPDEADIFKFQFTKDGKDYGTVYVTLDEDRVLTVYFGDDVSDSPSDKTPGLDYNDTWSGLLHQLSAWRMTKGLKGFNTQNKDRVSDDMARRNHMRNKDKIAEGYYPMGKSRSYSDAVPSVKIVIEHSRVIEEGEQRYRNINRIFLENQAGERYLLDTKKPGIARVYARHIAEGGKVNDDRWSHIGNLCEEYQKMAGFVRATRNGQFNESAQSLVNEGVAHYASLRESLSRMTGKRGYNSYFESWTPPLMEDGTEENNLNELFVQETLDPRIESVMPILNRIHKKVAESAVDKEMNKLAEWADSLVEDESIRAEKNPGGIPESETSTHKGGTVTSKNGVTQHKSGPGVYGGYDASRHPDSPEEKHVDRPGAKTGHRTDKVVKHNEVDENFINQVDQAVTTEGEHTQHALRGRNPGANEFEHDFEPNDKIGNIHDKISSMLKRLSKPENNPSLDDTHIGSTIYEAEPWEDEDEADKAGKKGTLTKGRMGNMKASSQYTMRGGPKGVLPEEVDLGQYDAVKTPLKGKDTSDWDKNFREKLKQYTKELDQRQKEKAEKTDEGLDANQKRVGQLGPTEKVKNNNIGKLVGANENFINTVDQAVVSEDEDRPYVCVHAKKGKCEVKASSSYQAAQKAAQKWGLKGTAGIDAHLADVEHDASTLEEMDKSQPSAGRDTGPRSGPEGKATPITPNKMADDAKNILDKTMSKEHKKEVKEGQDELDRILTIMNHRR